ncbi:hypothetical protein AALA22_13105 [Anaerovoracaceae bacterium 41-7]
MLAGLAFLLGLFLIIVSHGQETTARGRFRAIEAERATHNYCPRELQHKLENICNPGSPIYRSDYDMHNFFGFDIYKIKRALYSDQNVSTASLNGSIACSIAAYYLELLTDWEFDWDNNGSMSWTRFPYKKYTAEEFRSKDAEWERELVLNTKFVPNVHRAFHRIESVMVQYDKYNAKVDCYTRVHSALGVEPKNCRLSQSEQMDEIFEKYGVSCRNLSEEEMEYVQHEYTSLNYKWW